MISAVSNLLCWHFLTRSQTHSQWNCLWIMKMCIMHESTNRIPLTKNCSASMLTYRLHISECLFFKIVSIAQQYHFMPFNTNYKWKRERERDSEQLETKNASKSSFYLSIEAKIVQENSKSDSVHSRHTKFHLTKHPASENDWILYVTVSINCA